MFPVYEQLRKLALRAMKIYNALHLTFFFFSFAGRVSHHGHNTVSAL